MEPDIIKEIRRPDPSIVNKFSEHSTPNISDACERNQVMAACEGIIPMVPGVRIAGPAITARYVPLDPSSPGTTADIGEYMFEIAKAGDVIVLDNGGVTRYTCWGDILTATAMKIGIAGTVIDGVFRDYDTILQFRYPIFSRGRFMITGKDRLQLDAINVPVKIGGILVRPGDIIVGDDSGVLRIPRDKAEKILTDADSVREAENFIVDAVKKGMTLKEARAKFKYYQLQRPTHG